MALNIDGERTVCHIVFFIVVTRKNARSHDQGSMGRLVIWEMYVTYLSLPTCMNV